MAFVNKLIVAVQNIYDPSGKVIQQFFLKLCFNIKPLVESLKGSKNKESMKERAINLYIRILKSLCLANPDLWYRENNIAQLLDLMLTASTLNRPSIIYVANILSEIIEFMLNDKVNYKKIRISTNYPKEVKYDLPEKYNTIKEEIIKKNKEIEDMKNSKKREILEELLTRCKEINKGTISSNAEKSLIFILAIFKSHFKDDNKELLRISNVLAESLLSKGKETRDYCLDSVVSVLALRQRNVVSPIYIYKDEFDEAKEDVDKRLTHVNVSSELLKSKGVLGNALYIDRNCFGWMATPPYIRIYNSPIAFTLLPTEIQTADSLYQLLNSEEFVEELVDRAIFEHEAARDQKIMHDNETNKKSSNNLQRKTTGFIIIKKRIWFKAELFNLYDATFYQSCFEFYGPSILKHFLAKIDKVLNKEPNEASLAVVMEIIGGFLRASKVFDSEELKEKAYDVIMKVIRVEQQEFIKDSRLGLLFFLSDRDPLRCHSFWKKFLADFLSEPINTTLKKIKFLKHVCLILYVWNWRCKEFADEYMNWYIKNLVQDSQKAQSLAGHNLSLVLYYVFDYQSIHSVKPVEVTGPYKEKLEEALRTLIKNMESKDVKLSLLYILKSTLIFEKRTNQSYVWLLELLIPVCYSLTVSIFY